MYYYKWSCQTVGCWTPTSQILGVWAPIRPTMAVCNCTWTSKPQTMQ